jgi:hypothetical protein
MDAVSRVAVAWTALAGAVVPALVGVLVGMSQHIIEPGGLVVDCGRTLFRSGPSPSSLCAATDPWRVAAIAALGVAGCLLLAGLTLLLYAAGTAQARPSSATL